ncbi:MAG: hypothetical protein ACOCV1_06175 [Bacillota bacterium]
MLKSKKRSVSSLVFILAFVITIFLDFKFNFKSFLFIRSSNFISSQLLPILITVLTMFLAVYLLVVQLFRGRYPLNFIKKYFETNFTFHYAINFFVALILIVFQYDLLITKFVYIVHFIFLFYIFFQSYNNYRVFDPASKINKIEAEITETIDNDLNRKVIIEKLKELENYSEDSLLKNELFLSKYILRSYKNLIIHFLEKKDSKIISSDQITEEEVDEIEIIIFKSVITQLKRSIHLEQNNYYEEVIDTVVQIMKVSIDCNKLHDFELFTKELKSFFYYSADRGNINAAAVIIKIYSKFLSYLEEKDKFEEWVPKIEGIIKYFSFNTSEIYSSEKLLEEMFSFYYHFLDLLLTNNMLEKYQDLTEDILKFFGKTMPNIDNNTVKYFKIFNELHTLELIEKNDDQFIKVHLEFLNNIGRIGLFYDNKDICHYVMNGFDFMISENKDKKKIYNLINDFKFDYIIKLLEHKDELISVFIPEYKSRLENIGIKNDDLIDSIKDELLELIKRSLMTHNRQLSYNLLEKLNSIIFIYEKEHRKYQQQFLNLYNDILFFGLYNKDAENFHLILRKFQDLFFSLDKENKLSENLCLRFIEIYKKLNISSLEEKMVEFSISINHKLDEIREDSKLVNKKDELYQQISEALFQIGMRGVEYGVDDIIRNSSNRLGWIGKDSIDNNRYSTLKNVLDKAVKLINLCNDFKIKERTIIFNGTLFIILGGYSISVDDFQAVRLIKEAVEKIKCVSKLDNARLIRSYESDHWDDLMNGRASQCMSKFYKKLDLESC